MASAPEAYSRVMVSSIGVGERARDWPRWLCTSHQSSQRRYGCGGGPSITRRRSSQHGPSSATATRSTGFPPTLQGGFRRIVSNCVDGLQVAPNPNHVNFVGPPPSPLL